MHVHDVRVHVVCTRTSRTQGHMTGGVRQPKLLSEPCSSWRPARPHQEGRCGHVRDLGRDVRSGVAQQRRLHQPALVVHLLPLDLRVGHCAARALRVSDTRQVLARKVIADDWALPGFSNLERRQCTHALQWRCNVVRLAVPFTRRLRLQRSLPLAPWAPTPLAAGRGAQAGAGAVT